MSGLGHHGVGLVLAVVWKGIGEDVIMLARAGAGVVVGVRYVPSQMGRLATGAICAVLGLLFIVWRCYMRARRGPAHTIA